VINLETSTKCNNNYWKLSSIIVTIVEKMLFCLTDKILQSTEEKQVFVYSPIIDNTIIVDLATEN